MPKRKPATMRWRSSALLRLALLLPACAPFCAPNAGRRARARSVGTEAQVSTEAPADVEEPRMWPGWTKSVAPNSTLLYMSFLEHQLGVLEAMGAKPVELEDRLQYATKTKNDAVGARVASKVFKVEGLFRRVRMTYFDGGPSLQVFNSLWYPDFDRVDAPLLGIDLLAFGDKKLLCVVDAQPLRGRDEKTDGSAHATAALAAVRAVEGRDELRGSVSSRWYDDNCYFSKEMLYSRFEESGRQGIQAALQPAFEDYLAAYIDVVRNAPVDAGHADSAREAQRVYDDFNAERDPAHGLFTSYFGEQWANDFVRDFLFKLSAPKEPHAPET
ncbi:ferredoxin-dependent bilin reductase-domain-containing protein [Pelagophyceae sp. CCMP2097]|nr:ferredoxin-dependent bilin reductase-domain-containing protein [Pelagophyceae sp. CCMP2097]